MFPLYTNIFQGMTGCIDGGPHLLHVIDTYSDSSIKKQCERCKAIILHRPFGPASSAMDKKGLPQ